jgi:Fe-S cluster assembly protein SufD
MEVPLPLVTRHATLADGSSLFPHTLIVAEDNASVTVLDIYQAGNPGTRNFVCAASDVYALPGSRVHYRMIRTGRSTPGLPPHAQRPERDSYLKTSRSTRRAHVRIGTRSHRCPWAPRSRCTAGRRTGHAGTRTTARSTRTSTAENRATCSTKTRCRTRRARLQRLIRVEKDAQQTDAYQTNRNLLLSPEADANSLPGLEIGANDVKCSHGATTGQVDESELFYFLARGIPRSKAQELLVHGFFEEIIGKFDNEDLAAHVRELLERKLAE